MIFKDFSYGSLLRVFLALATAGLVYFSFNPTIFFHLDDFINEMRFLGNWYPFKVRWGSVGDFIVHILRPSVGNILFISGLLGLLCYGTKTKEKIWKRWAVGLAFSALLASFQLQAVSRDPLQARLFLPFVGVTCFFSAVFVDSFSWRRWLGGLCVLVLMGNALLYVGHFQSDRAPFDNASQASVWIKDHVPIGATIQHLYVTPTPDQLPPLNFYNYNFIPWDESPGVRIGAYFVVNARGFTQQSELERVGYRMEKRFENSTFQKWGFVDPFTNANFPVWIFRKQ